MVLAAAVLFTGATHSATAEQRDLLLAVVLNGRPLETVVQAIDHDGDILVAPDDFSALGLKEPGGASPARPVSLRTLTGVRYRIDEPHQLLLIDAMPEALPEQTIGMPMDLKAPDAAGYGALLNYDLFGITGVGAAGDALLDARGLTPFGTFGSSVLAGTGRFQHVARLDSGFSHPDFDANRTWRFGDAISGGLSWSRPFRLAGVQVQTSFAMRPDLVTYPLPALGGRTSVPSSVDVLVNGVRQLSSDVQPGPFSIQAPPSVTGSGEISMVTRDVFGQQTVQSVQFYISPQLLKPGLASYSVEAGLLRSHYGLPGDRYTRAIGSASLRYGARSWLTLEAHGEGASDFGLAGAGVILNLANQGLLTLAGQASGSGHLGDPRMSRRSAGFGHGYTIGVERNTGLISFGVRLDQHSANLQDIPALAGDVTPRRTLTGSLTWSGGWFGTLRAAVVMTQGGLIAIYNGRTTPVLRPGTARIASVSYSRPLTDRISLYATSFRDFSSGGAFGGVAGISLPLGPTRSLSVSTQAGSAHPSGQVDASQNAILPGDTGWHVHTDLHPPGTQMADVFHVFPFARATMGADQSGSRNDVHGQVQGALVLSSGGLFATRRVQDSFAIVDTAGVPEVPVLLENRPIGATNQSGQLLVPDLRGWDENRLSIDPTMLPADVEARSLSTVVRPPDHAGMVVPFRLRKSRGAVIRLVDQAGSPLPVGSQARLVRSGRKLTVGFDGEIYDDDVQDEEQIQVRMVSGSCEARFHFIPRPGEIPVIGPVTCAATSHH